MPARNKINFATSIMQSDRTNVYVYCEHVSFVLRFCMISGEIYRRLLDVLVVIPIDNELSVSITRGGAERVRHPCGGRKRNHLSLGRGCDGVPTAVFDHESRGPRRLYNTRRTNLADNCNGCNSAIGADRRRHEKCPVCPQRRERSRAE